MRIRENYFRILRWFMDFFHDEVPCRFALPDASPDARLIRLLEIESHDDP